MTNTVDETHDGSVAAKAPNRSRGVKLFLRDILLIFLAALLISFLIKTFLIRSFYIPSESMESTLLVNDRIIVNQLTPDLMPIKHGDVVVFKDPGGWLDPVPTPVQSPVVGAIDSVLGFVGLSAPDSNDHLIKRVIGMPGDHVICCDEFGHITVNGVGLDEPYIIVPPGSVNASPETFDITVPADSLWVLGDNRYQSADSAFHHANEPGHEYVPYSDVVGRAVLVSWPITRWSWLDDYPLVFSDVDGESQE